MNLIHGFISPNQTHSLEEKYESDFESFFFQYEPMQNEF